MTRSSRFLLAGLASLVVAGPAWAGSDQAPGQIKKTVAPTSEAPAAAPVTTQPVTTPTASAPTAPTAPQAQGKAPVNKGTVKKLTKTTTTVAPSSSGPAPVASTKATVHRRRSTTSSATTTRASTTTHHSSASSHTSASRSSASRARGTSTTTNPAVAAIAAHRLADAPRHPRHAARSAHRAAPRPKAKTDTTAPLTSISRAADRVIEVIPGAVVLALAGLVALVLVLIARSWAMERRRGQALERSYGVTVEALATAIEAKDHCTGGHIERVRKLGLLLARQMVPREARDPQMAYGFLLHDIGKLAVPDEILRAPGRLTAEQWALMRRHPEEGVRMLQNVPFLDKALDVVRHHHERWDGGGYPSGLRGEEIPLWARIFSVVDALDAMTAARPYRSGRSYADALDEIREHAGSQFDPAVVEALERIDPAEIEPLLEPTQLIDSPLAPVTDLRPLISA